LFRYLDAPVQRVGSTFTPVGFNPILERAILPGADRIYEAAKKLFSQTHKWFLYPTVSKNGYQSLPHSNHLLFPNVRQGFTLFIEPKALYNSVEAATIVPDDFEVPFGKARIRREFCE